MRPLALTRESEELEVGEGNRQVLCRSSNVMGNGRLDGIRDVSSWNSTGTTALRA